MSFLLSPIGNESQIDSNGDPLSGGFIETYLAGTSTPSPTFTSITGAVPQTNPVVLNTLGLPPSPIWLDSNIIYKFVIKNSIGIVQRTVDNIAGVSSLIPTQDQWVNFVGTPTFISTTSFSLTGDQTGIFGVSRRIKTVNTGGVVYSSIIASVFGAVTTVTVLNDSGVLDSGLSQVSYGILSNANPSVPQRYARASYVSFTGVEVAFTAGAVAAGVGTFTATVLGIPNFQFFSLSNRMRFRVSFNVIGGSSNTLNINGSGAKPVVAVDVSNNSYSPPIVTFHTYDIEYDGSNYIVLNPIANGQEGEYFFWPTGVTPSHGILCNGAAISRTTYARLFAKIGTTYGVGDGSTTFNVPNIGNSQVLLSGAGVEGTFTPGSVIAHTHGIQINATAQVGSTRHVVDNAAPTGTDVTNSTGSPTNIAAGTFARCCIRF